MNKSKINTRSGTFYAYTLQGWLKGVNSESLLASRDMGKDGVTTNINQNFGKDAFGYTLGYYEGDYAPIGTGSFEATKTGSDLMAARNNLYNGNISSMVTTITNPMTGEVMPNAFAYQYDQLNRIVEAKAYANIDMNGNTWQTGSTYADRYYNHYTYDDNGNILTALVKNDAGQTIDDQTYHYKTMYGHRINNKLYAITDNAAVTGGFDLTDQTPYDNESAANNYGYTEIGELKWDVSDKIDDIKRRTDGKITEITRTPGSGKTNLKFDYDPLGKRIAKHSYTDAGYWIESEYYVRDAKGVIMSTYKYTVDTQNETASFKQTERFIYGSSLLGIDRTQTELIAATTPTTIEHVVGNKNYSLQNHLQNDLVVISDLKIPHDDNSDGTIDYYTSDIVAAKDYGVFGEYLANRVFNPNDYPNSFNGKRDDQELNGWQDYGERNYMKYRRGFDRTDPLIVNEQKYPELSTYQFASNTPIMAVDWDGLEARVYTEIKGTGHTFITVGDAKDVIVYTYGRYAELGKDKSSAQSTTPTGQGVLIRLTGNDAQSFLQDQLYNKNANVFEITDASEADVKTFFEGKFNASNQIPTKGKYAGDDRARVIDKYNLFNNNCTTISCDGIQAGGSKTTDQTTSNLSGTGFSTISTSTEQKDFVLPLDFQNYLQNMSNGSNVKNVTEDIKKQIPAPAPVETTTGGN